LLHGIGTETTKQYSKLKLVAINQSQITEGKYEKFADRQEIIRLSGLWCIEKCSSNVNY